MGWNVKPVGPHPDKALTAVKVRSINSPGRYADGNGLYLVVDASGAKRWMLRTVVLGRRRDIGLGSLRLVSLAEARTKAVEYRQAARDGRDPVAEKRKARQTIPCFREAAEQVHAEHCAAWKNAKHSAQWIATLRQYAFPIIGEARVDAVTTPDVLKVLAPIWLTRPETARRLKQRVGTVLDWASASGFRSGENPADGVTKGLPRQPDRKHHHRAVPYAEVPGFLHRLRSSGNGEIVKLAFEFLVLTATRTGEVLGARWREVDLDTATWIIPAERMKAGVEHRVPLGPRGAEIIQAARVLSAESPFVFPGRSGNSPLSNMAFLMVLRRMDVAATAHGFRSAFRDWCAERTNFPREVCEMALAHTIRNKTEAAYRRGDLLEKRRDLMATWEAFATATSAEIVPLRA